MAASLVTVLTRIRDRLRSYYWTPKIVTATISSVSIGHTFQLNFGSNLKTTSYTAVDTSATTVAAAITANINLRQENGHFGAMTATSALGVITITGGAYNFDTPTASGTGSVAFAVSQEASDLMFRDVHAVPVFDARNPGASIRNTPGAVVFRGRERPVEDGSPITIAEVSVLCLTENHREQFNETALLDTQGLTAMVEKVKRDLVYRSDTGSSSPPDLVMRWNETGSPGVIQAAGNRAGWIAQEIQFEVEYLDTVA